VGTIIKGPKIPFESNLALPAIKIPG
jgi:hypothetical protein